VNYRLKSTKEPFSKFILDRAVSDVNSAIRWIVKNKKNYKADVTRILICGDSAGGALVVNTAFQDNPPVNFIGCIDLWGGLPDYGLPGKQNWNEPIDKYLNLKAKLIPVCIVHGTSDSVIPFQTSVNFDKQLKANGNKTELHLLKDADHYPEEKSEELIKLMFAFTNKLFEMRF
jgi:acetyl esterase/lipase